MTPETKTILAAGAILGVFSLLGMGSVAWVHQNTEARIKENQKQWLLYSLNELLPAGSHDNDLLADAIEVSDPILGTKPVRLYRARRGGRPAALILTPIAPDGYNGEIRLLVAIDAGGTVSGVRVLEHRETPGLGDAIEENKSRWILGFEGLSLKNPPENSWKVKRDGGAFDQFAGATVTPRAVVRAVKNSLMYVTSNQGDVFSRPAQSELNSALLE